MRNLGMIILTVFWTILTIAAVISLFIAMGSKTDTGSQLLWTIVAVVVEVILVKGLNDK